MDILSCEVRDFGENLLLRKKHFMDKVNERVQQLQALLGNIAKKLSKTPILSQAGREKSKYPQWKLRLSSSIVSIITCSFPGTIAVLSKEASTKSPLPYSVCGFDLA